jgi:hypothetical protein
MASRFIAPGIAGLGAAAAGTGAKVGLKVIGNAAAAAYGAVAGTARALGTLSGALNSAAADLNKQKPEKQESPTNVIYVNFGMAGSAGKQRITGGGNLPSRKNVAKPQVSEKMPTEALLDTAVKYLSSIDKSLKAQLEFEKRSYEQQVKDERESIIEERKSSFNFSDIKDRLSGFKSSAKEAGGTLATIAKFAAGLGAAAALAAASLDTKQLEELQASIDTFKEKFSFLSEIPAGGLSGFLVGLLFGKGIAGRLKSGVKGGLIGILTSAVADVIFSNATGGEISEDTRSVLNIGAAGAIGYLGYRGIQSIRTTGMALPGNLRAARATMSEQMANRSYYNPSNQRVQNLATGRMMATNTATGFLKSPRWQRFLNWLTSNGKRTLVNKIQQRIAIATASGAVAATGVGAAFGAIGFLLNLGFSLFLMYEIYQLWQQFTSQDEAEAAGVGDAEIAAELNGTNNADATRVAGSALAADRIVSRSETGRPEEAQAFFESKGWSREQAAGIVGNLVVESGLRTDIVGDGGRAYGIAQWHPDRQARFKEVYGKDIRQSSFQEQLEFVNWELNNSEKAAGDALRGATTAADAAAIVDSQYERSAGLHLARRQENAAAIMAGDFGKVTTGGAAGYSGGGGDSAMSKMANASLESMGKILGAIGGAVVAPGIAKNLTSSTPDASETINRNSLSNNSNIDLGIATAQAKADITSPTTPGVLPGVSQPIVSISSMDPNYGNINIVSRYLAHFKMAAG